ncbi:FtsH protease activity modulator HflK [Candidatus Pacearchaeota archaeon]|nr:FtsH protease activity modulator HflK [Candidatus Pacearchaeota archaeon]
MASSDLTFDYVKNAWNSVKSNIKWGLAGLVAANIAWSSWYVVPTGSRGVVKRLGAYSETTGEGPHAKIPLFVESVTKVPVTKVYTEAFGFRTLKPGIDSKYLGESEIISGDASGSDLENFVRNSGVRTISQNLTEQVLSIFRSEYLMLTGDLNMADVEWIVQYQIRDPRAYLFNVNDPVQTLRDASLATMKRIMGNSSVDEAINIGRVDNEILAKEEMQELMNSYGTGMQIVTVRFQSTNPPRAVRDAFNEVNKAQQDKEKKINDAMKVYNEFVPKTRGEAEQVVKEAEGYAIRSVNEAQGDSARFMKQWTEYRNAPAITRQRLYLEAMEEVIPNAGEVIIIDDKGLEGGGLLNVLGMEGPKK